MSSNFSLHSLGYTSRACRDLSEEEFASLQANAARMNALDGITGILVYTGNRFAQIVEGSENAIEELLDRLKKDDRHTDLRVHFSRPIEQRSFPSWDMKLSIVSSIRDAALRQISALIPSGSPSAANEDIAILLANCFD